MKVVPHLPREGKIIGQNLFWWLMIGPILGAASAVAGLPEAYFAPEVPLGEKAWAVQTTVDYFNRQAAYNDDGQKVEASHFTRTQGEVSFAYGFTDQIFAAAGGRYRQNKGEQSSQGLESMVARLGYGAWFDPAWLGVLSLQWRHAMFKTAVDEKDLALGDDGDELSVQGSLFWPRKERQIWSLAVAYVAPHDLSTEIDYRLQGTWLTRPRPTGPNWSLGVGVEGVVSLKQGPYQQDPSQRPKPWPSTNLYRSFNRAWTIPFVQIAAGEKNWHFSVQGGMHVQGNSTDKGITVLANLVYRGGGISQTTRKIERFKEYAVEGMVIQVSPRGKFVKIDQGLRDGLDRGSTVDIFQSDYLGQNILFAAGTVYQVGDTWAVVRILSKFKTEPLQTGMIIRAK